MRDTLISIIAFIGVLPVAICFKNLEKILQQYAEIQEAKDVRRVGSNPGYFHKVEEYDFVIIGAGSAGALVANRLSKHRNIRVLILQDGGNPNPIVNVPGLANEIRRKPTTDYSYRIVKQKKACLAPNAYESNCLVNRGIGLGGTSNFYSMTVIQGNSRDYDEWAELTGDSSWGYSNVLKVFKKLEDYHGYYQPIDEQFHGLGGESYVSAQLPSPLPPLIYDACAELGLPINIDPNANQSVGCAHLDINIKRGIRWGSYNAFLKPILSRPNLKIYRYAKAVKINFDANLRATGVTYVRHGVEQTVNAKHEVVLCAGSIDSPKLLMLSGIGPTEWLKSVGVKQLVNLPVGKTLVDHIGANLEFTVSGPNIAFVPQRDTTPAVLLEYATNGTGPYASPFFNPRALVYMTTKEFNSPLWPDIEVLYRGEYENTSLGNNVYQNKILAQVILMRPLSSGYLRLASKNPSDPPVIDPQIFSNSSDLNRLAEGVRFAVKLLRETKVFKNLDVKLIRLPACEKYLKRKQKYAKCIVQQATFTLCHPVGTVKMGSADDMSAVLDSKLRVRGTSGLRVVDSSVMPTVPDGHTHTPTLMIGEMGSQFILSKYFRSLK